MSDISWLVLMFCVEVGTIILWGVIIYFRIGHLARDRKDVEKLMSKSLETSEKLHQVLSEMATSNKLQEADSKARHREMMALLKQIKK